ncbi:MAG: inner membrane protein [Alphaproteobacteria bacterium]|jgi:inner membrane protein|nr:inner membrane protein [Alphaproteobacteria bacterium]
MIDYLITLGAWNWLILGAVFLALELVAPGAFMLWLGLAALAVGLISFAVDWSWQAQFVTFAVLSLALIPVWRRFAPNVEQPSEAPLLNRRAESYIGRTFTLENPIVDGVGRVRIDDTIWRVSGPDSPAGSQVRIMRVEGPNLFVERV